MFWLQLLQPVFAAVAVASLAWQVWAVRRRPASLQKPGVKVVLITSVALNVLVIGGWAALWVRYR